MANADLMLSLHFPLSDFTYSETAIRLGKPIIVDKDGPIFMALSALCENILEPMWEHFGPGLRITSGYRPPDINAAIGGSSNSQHCKGEAADIQVKGVPVKEVALWVAKSALPFDQVIEEFGAWTHVSFSTAQTARGSVLTASRVNGKTVYSPGIVA